jgi:IS5 family transposase
VQGVEPAERELWDAAQVVGHLVPVGSMFGFLADHRAEVFPDEDYADLFSTVGRPSLPATRMAAVLALQALHGLSDRECAEAVRGDLRWKVACGLSLLDEGFDPSSLVYWRRRIAKSDRPYRVNDAVRQVIEATGVLAGRRRRAVDSTILDDAVATQDTITQLIGAVRRVGREVPGADAVIAAVCTGHDYSGVGKPRIDWTDPAAKDALVSALVTDANAVLAALAGTELDEPAAVAVALLALVAGQDVEPAEGSDGRDGRWRIARKVAPDRVISTVDPQARHTRKSPSNRKDGYRAHLVAEPETGLITDEALTMAAGAHNSDAAIAQKFLTPDEQTPDEQGDAPSGDGPTEADPAPVGGDDTAEEATTSDNAAPGDPAQSAASTDAAGENDTAGENADGENADGENAADDADAHDHAPAESSAAGSSGQDEALSWYGDSAYGTGELRGEIERAGHHAVIKPKPVQPAVPGGFTIDDFTVDEGAATLTCPAGLTRPISTTRTVSFGAVCRDCPLRVGCTTAKAGRTMVLHERDDLLRAARADWAADPALREDYRTYRPNIERTVSQVATQSGRRIKLRYRGTTKNNAWLKYRTAALNLRNLIGRGLTRVDRTWVLAT